MKINLWGASLEINVSLPKSAKEVQMTGFYNLVPVGRVGAWELCDQTLYDRRGSVTQVYHQAGHVIVHVSCDVMTTPGKGLPACPMCGQEMSYEEVCLMDDVMFKHKREVHHA